MAEYQLELTQERLHADDFGVSGETTGSVMVKNFGRNNRPEHKSEKSFENRNTDEFRDTCCRSVGNLDSHLYVSDSLRFRHRHRIIPEQTGFSFSLQSKRNEEILPSLLFLAMLRSNLDTVQLKNLLKLIKTGPQKV